MRLLNNITTADAYTDAATLGPVPDATQLTYVVANNSVFMQLYSGQYGSVQESAELLVTPTAGAFQRALGARFRSAVPGQPAQIVAAVWEPHDPQPLGSTPFVQNLSATGVVSVAQVSSIACDSTGALNPVPQPLTDVPGAIVNFTVVGANAEIVFVQEYDFQVTVAGIGFAAGYVLLDGANQGAAVMPDLVARATVGHTRRRLIAAGAHTLKLQAQKANAGGTVVLNSATCSIVLIDK